MIGAQPNPGLQADTECTMADPVERQSGTTASSREADMKQHSDERFARLEEELERQNSAQSLQRKIIISAVSVGAIVWAWAAMR
jgi:hypothetical protein